MADPPVTAPNNEPVVSESIMAIGARELGLALGADQLARFDRFQVELLDWNERMNLTSIVEPRAVQSRHFLDSLTVLGLISGPSAQTEVSQRIVDIGAGAGLPGVPLAIVLPRAQIVLIEATRKKCEFLQHLVAALGLTNVEVIWGRAEEVAHRTAYRATFDHAVVRALALLPTLVELGVPFLHVGGKLIAMKKIGIEDEIEAARQAVNLVGGRFGAPIIVNVPVLNEKRLLVLVEKVKPTPRDYPRRDGIPAKSPLGGSPARPAGLARSVPNNARA